MARRSITFSVPGKPRGLPRPRVAVVHGQPRVYDSKSAKALKARIRAAYLDAAGLHVPHKGRVTVQIDACFKPPSKWRVALRKAAYGNPATTGDDVDNIAKAVLDALNECAYDDDRQVSDIKSGKYYGPVPNTLVSLLLHDYQETGGRADG